jgi:hypothetical protein
MDAFTKLKQVFCDYDTCVATNNNVQTFEIVNPNWEENIRVVTEENGFIFFFAYQHAHFDYDDVDNLISYVRDYLSEQRVSIEFFCEDDALFGGDSYLNNIDFSSGESLLRSFTGENDDLYMHIIEGFIGRNCCCKIRCWNDKNNQDIEFRIDV